LYLTIFDISEPVSIDPTSDVFSGATLRGSELPEADDVTGPGRFTIAEAAHAGRPYAVPYRELSPPSRPLAEAAYRVFEIFVAALGLLLFSPLMLLEAVLVRLDSPGPALFVHRRPARSVLIYGRDLEGRTDLRPPPGGYQPDVRYFVPSYFKLTKFRTMRIDARARFPELYAYKFEPHEFHLQMPTLRHDPRVTRIGRILRRLSIDELPNLWSVLKGDMRLVGPRPEAPEVLQYYLVEEMYKFAVKPGITGLAQINGRGLLNWGETLAWDLEYVRTRSVMLDLKILLLTLQRVLFRHGAF
jgi:lipopolysaccharide/colanic/teichoic acid biosynthesis glycosyltransferase